MAQNNYYTNIPSANVSNAWSIAPFRRLSRLWHDEWFFVYVASFKFVTEDLTMAAFISKTYLNQRFSRSAMSSFGVKADSKTVIAGV